MLYFCISLADDWITLLSTCEKVLLYKRTSIWTEITQAHIAFSFPSQSFFLILTWFIGSNSGFECKAELLKTNKAQYHKQVHVCLLETEKRHLQILYSCDAVEKPPRTQQTACNITKNNIKVSKSRERSHGIEEETGLDFSSETDFLLLFSGFKILNFPSTWPLSGKSRIHFAFLCYLKIDVIDFIDYSSSQAVQVF